MTINITSTNQEKKRPRVRITGAVKINAAAFLLSEFARTVACHVSPEQAGAIKKAWRKTMRARLWA